MKINRMKRVLIQQHAANQCLILSGGFTSFCDQYPFLVVHGKSTRRMIKYPNEILQSALFLGDGQQAVNEKVIDDLKITHIANITQNVQCAFSSKIKYIQIAVEDEQDTDLSVHILNVVEFIDNALRGNGVETGNRVLVHCQCGVSRSASMVIGYVMFANRWSFEPARDFVKERRSKISPNEGFVKQLIEYQRVLEAENLSKSNHNPKGLGGDDLDFTARLVVAGYCRAIVSGVHALFSKDIP